MRLNEEFCRRMDMKTDTKIILIGILVICILLSINLFVLLSTEHYNVARYEVESIQGHTIYYDGGKITINPFYLPIENDLKNLTKGDDILVHYFDSILGDKTFIRIENLTIV